MSEKICACLLRLYPAAFRNKYREEALQFYRDRLRDEPGLLHRCRLYFDLLADTLIGLPQAWRNSYSPAGAPSLAASANSTPSFRSLDTQPLRPASILIGSTLSFAALAAFGWLMGLPLPALPFSASHQPRSPIEAVMDRLNQPAPPPNPGPATGANPSASVDTPLAQAPAGNATPVSIRPGFGINVAERDRVIHGVATILLASYFDHQKAAAASDTLLAREKQGDYDSLADGPALAKRLTSDLANSTSDPHLVVAYSQIPIPGEPRTATPAMLAEYRAAMLQQHCAFEKVAILPNNIGYIKLNSFPDPSICGATARAALRQMNSASAIIFDLRDNIGGTPEMVADMASPLFDHPVPWYNPRANPSASTLSPEPGSRLADKPVYILTSSRTFSGAEHFTYDLKMLKRAIVVGETTGGASHSGAFHRIDEHFGMGIPEHPIANPYGQPDWAITGVQPDVKVNAAEALATAEKLALQAYKK